MRGKKTIKQTNKRILPVLVCLVLAAVVLLLAGPVRRAVEINEYPSDFSAQVQKWAAEYGVDANLIYAVIHTESGFNPKAQSAAGARGLMQMTQDTFDWIKTKIAPKENITFDDLYTPDISIRFGSYFLSICLTRYGGDVSTAAAAYHSGWGTVDKLLRIEENTQDGVKLDVFPYKQMRHYVYKITRSYSQYIMIYSE